MKDKKLQQMRAVRDSLLAHIRSLKPGELLSLVTMKDYHGFSKSRFPEELLTTILAPFGLSPQEVQAELVSIEGDLRHEVHVHHEAHAAVVMLGAKEHLPEPVDAEAYLADGWIAVVAGQEIDIPAETDHGFTGRGYFLSVQAPPIEREGGHDDYEKVQV